MGKPYSLDLRKRVVAAVEGGMSHNQAAKHFGIAISTAINWMKRVDETGSVAPGQMGGHKPKAISGEHAVWLSQRIRNDDFTLRGLVAELAGRCLKVDYHSVWISCTPRSSASKKAWWLANASAPTRRVGAPSGQSIKVASKLSVWSSSTRVCCRATEGVQHELKPIVKLRERWGPAPEIGFQERVSNQSEMLR
ncbi:transposase [Bradyrhizobium sp. WSM 1738]|nr:transposase [Bradyrhizobium hereditatis]